MQEQTLIIVQSQKDAYNYKDHPKAGIIVIDEEELKITDEELSEVFFTLVHSEVKTEILVPLYNIFLPYLLTNNRNEMNMLSLLVLYKKVDELITLIKPVYVKFDHELEFKYILLVSDICEKRNIQTHGVKIDKRNILSVKSICKIFLDGIRIILDQYCAILLRLIDYQGISKRYHTVIRLAFFPNRIINMYSVIEESNRRGIPNMVFYSKSIVKHFWGKRSKKDADINNKTEVIPLNAFASVGLTIKECQFILKYVKEILYDRKLEKEINELLEKQYDISMPSTLKKSLNNVYVSSIVYNALFNAPSLEAMLRNTKCKKVVIGAMSPFGRTVIEVANKMKLQSYHVPQTMVNDFWYPSYETIEFVSGILDINHLVQLKRVKSTVNLLPVGRPYLVEAYKNYKKEHIKGNEDRKIEVIIATQPYRNHIRESFLRDVLDSISINSKHINIRIKLHPGEKKDFYESIVSDFNKYNYHGNLFEIIKEADLVVTINSNVGLDSMIIGTPCVCYNPYGKMLSNSPYARYGPVPVFRDKSSMTDFFAKLTLERLSELQKIQHAFVVENYNVNNDATNDMVDYLEDKKYPEQI